MNKTLIASISATILGVVCITSMSFAEGTNSKMTTLLPEIHKTKGTIK